MRKSRIKLNEIDPTLLQAISSDPIQLIFNLESLEVAIPKWAILLLVGFNEDLRQLDLMFFEETQDFFLRYAKQAIRRSDQITLHSFMNKEAGWKVFDPPTLIGSNLQTRLRPPKPIME